MKLFQWFKRAQPRGIHAGEAATHWASTRFATHLQPVAATIADLLCEHAGIGLCDIEPASTFVVDFRMDDLEPVEFVMALEQELGIEIPVADSARLDTVSVLVSYLYERLSANAGNT